MTTSTVESFAEREDAFEILGLRNEFVEIKILPELGGRILSLRDLRSGREWMDRPLRPALFRNSYGDDFSKGTFAGADECIPTIAPVRWKGRDLPDHGEIWTLGWTVDEAALQDWKIRTSVDLQVSPLTFCRTITLCGEKVVLDYKVTNRGEEEEVFLWAHHPLYTIQPGDALRLPTAVHDVFVTGAEGSVASLAGTSWRWPEPRPGIHLDKLDLGGEGYAKFFAGPLLRGEAAIVNGVTGDGLEVRWDASLNPWLGIWLTRGAYMGFHHLAIEPTNGCGDALDTVLQDASAKKTGKAPLPLPPGASRSWRLGLQLTHHPRNP
jgi:galactose mutarotase-like enzyme